MRKQFYLDIKNRLKAVKDGNDEQVFRHFDLWNEQVAFEQETPFACPAVFIEFTPMVWKTHADHRQNCDTTVRLHVVTEWQGETFDGSPEEEPALAFLDISDRLMADLKDFGTDYMNNWTRIRSITNHNHDLYVDNVEEFACSLHDFSAMREYVPVTPDLTITT